MDWRCDLCNRKIRGIMAQAYHKRNYYMDPSDPLRCDNRRSEAASASASVEAASTSASVEPASASVGPANKEIPALEVLPADLKFPNVNLVPADAGLASNTLRDLMCRQETTKASVCSRRRQMYRMCSSRVPPGTTPLDMTEVQEAWQKYIRDVRGCASNTFWNFFLSIHTEAGTAINAALSAVKNNFMQEKTDEWSGFHTNRRTLRRAISNIPGIPFWNRVLHTVQIDLTSFKLPKYVKHLEFTFVDPIFAWIQAARRQPPDEMHWRVAREETSTGERLFGCGVQQGRAFELACRSCPEGTYPMGFAVHWDGTSGHGLSASPLAIGVANTNSEDRSTQFCIGYIPKLPQMGKAFYSKPIATKVKFYIRQKVVAAVLSVLTAFSEKGVLCRLKNCVGVDVDLHLIPKLISVNIDQPEAQLFYGVTNRCTCTRCTRRKGYSAFRKCSRQDGATIRLLYRILQDEAASDGVQNTAREKLVRHGFNPDRYCCLHWAAHRLLPHTMDTLPGVFPGLDFRDIMHGLYMFMYRCVCEAMNAIHWTPKGATQELLDTRMTLVGLQRAFRFPETNQSYRVQRSIFSQVDMSASDKICALFYLPHVFGHRGLKIPELVRSDLLTIIARTQLMFVAVRQRRMYTKSEYERIFDEGFKTVFKCLEHIYHVDFQFKMTEYHQKLQRQRKKPAKKLTLPKAFQRTTRSALYIHPSGFRVTGLYINVRADFLITSVRIID